MKYIYQDFYGAFGCLASECPDTCCKGWEIIIDDKSFAKYEKSGDNITDKIKTDEDGDRVFVQKNGECPFLDENRLCRLITKYGEEILCDVCRQHPRFIEEYGEFTEISLSPSCPGVSLILRDKDSLTQYAEKITDEQSEYSIDDPLLGRLSALRAEFFKSLKDESLRQAVEALIKNAVKLQEETDSVKYNYTEKKYDFIGMLSELEILTDEWRGLIKNLPYEEPSELDGCEMYLKNLASYFAYRYILKAVNDGNVITKAEFIKFSLECIIYIAQRYDKSLPPRDRLMHASRLYSKEIEHDEDNIEALYAMLEI